MLETKKHILGLIMMFGRALVSTLVKKQFTSYAQAPLLNRKQNLTLVFLTCNLSSHHVTKNIEFLKQNNEICTPNTTIQNFNDEKNRPLLVILSWLLSKRKHVMKFVNLYLEQGFDVAMVSVTPWQLLWPAKGTRVIASDLLEFLMQQQNYQQILLHGFSVGGYMWGEVLDFVHTDRKKYDNVIDRIVGQVWDSAADVTEFSEGTIRAVFPNNLVLQHGLHKYLEYHMKTFYNQSTRYYIRSSQLFHTNIVRAPALFLISKPDPIGTLSSNMRVRDSWDSMGVETYVKIFEKSPHVGHFQRYPKEYVAELYTFLNKLSLVQNEEKIRARL